MELWWQTLPGSCHSHLLRDHQTCKTAHGVLVGTATQHFPMQRSYAHFTVWSTFSKHNCTLMKYAKVASEHHNKAHLRQVMPFLKAYTSATQHCKHNDLQKNSPHGHRHKSKWERFRCWTSWRMFNLTTSSPVQPNLARLKLNPKP